MEQKVLLPILKKHLSDGDEVPYFFRDFIAMITDVKEEEWGTKLDPSTKKVKDETIRTYYKRGLPKKFAQNIVYRLNRPYLRERIEAMPEDARHALAEDLAGYDPSVNAENVADYVMEWVIEGIQLAAGYISQDNLQKQKELQRSADLKIRYGDYLLAEENNCCGVPGCGKSLLVVHEGNSSHVYEVARIDKAKDDDLDNLIAMCPTCHATYMMDNSKKRQKEIAAVKNTLRTHMQSIPLLDDIPLEPGIVGVVKRIQKLKEKDFETAKLDPKEIKQKLSLSEDAPIYFVVNTYVTTYFKSIKAIMMNLDKSGEIDFEEIQDQMHAIYRRLKKTKRSKIEIFDEIVEKVKRVTLSEPVYHPVFFRFKFPDEDRRFARATDDPDRIQLCNENYDLTGVVYTKNQFTDWLKKKYGIDFPELKFRLTISGFFRIYGKHNYDETHPLCGRPAQNMQESIEVLEKLFDRYKDIEVFNTRMKDAEAELKIYNEARSHDFISNLVGGKEKFEENEALIRSLENQLETLMTSQIEHHALEDIQKGEQKSIIQSQKLRLEIERDALQRRRRLLDVSLEYGLYPTENDMAELQKYFPSVNLRKLYEVEKYHQKLAKILSDQFIAERQELDERIVSLQASITKLEEEIDKLGITENISKEFLDKHAELNRKIYALRNQNEAYKKKTELQDAKKAAVDRLRKATETILFEIEKTLNAKMESFNDSLYEEKRKPPHLHFKAYNSYSFETPDDTGAGSNYKGMVIYDLAVLFSTDLPALAHDSNILKNIGDKPVNGIMKIYETSKKQIFIAFDKQAAYMPDTQRILEEHTVLHLSDNGSELYGESWNKEVSNNENKL